MTQLHPRGRRALRLIATLLFALLVLTACGRSKQAPPTPTPPPPTATPTPIPPTPTPVSADPAGGADAPDADATPIPTPEVTIPQGFTVQTDDARGYSLALPRGWTTLDLRSDKFQGLAGTFGLGEQLAPLNDFLDSPDGQAVGMVAATDLAGMMFGGAPTLLNVSIVDAPGATPASVIDALRSLLDSNASLLGDVQIESLEPATINNLPAVTANLTADLSAYGLDRQLYVDVTGLIANDKVYVLTLATEAGKRADKAAEFAQIIGSFRPE